MLVVAQCASAALASAELSAFPERSTATQRDSEAHEPPLGWPALAIVLADQLMAGAAPAVAGARAAAPSDTDASTQAHARGTPRRESAMATRRRALRRSLWSGSLFK